MAKIQLFILSSFIANVVKASLLSLLLSSNVQRPIQVRTLEEVNRRSHEDFVVLDFIGLIEQYDGYTAEEYKVETDDGYILGLHRITGSPKSPKADNKSVVYIAHGWTGSSDVMVDLGPQRSIAFELADAGYDVWLGNLRGNTHSRSHVKYSPEENEFWNFSMDESAIYDISKLIDFALDKSGRENLTYIGYSMGTTLSYMLLSEKPEYNRKINLLISLAPAVYFLEPINWRIQLYFLKPLLWRADLTNTREILPQAGELATFAKDYCGSEQSNYCTSFLSTATNIETLNATTIPTIFTYAPAGTSYNTLDHYNQLLNGNGKLRKYNSKRHASSPDYDVNYIPPEYDITRVTVPNVILYCKNDFFVKVQETEYLKSKLSNVTVFEAIADEKFNHLDFLWSTTAKTLVYDRVIEIMSKLL